MSFRSALALPVLLVLLAGCSSGDTAGTPVRGSATGAAPATSSTTGTAAPGDSATSSVPVTDSAPVGRETTGGTEVPSLEELRGEVDDTTFALSQFGMVFGPVPGSIEVAADDHHDSSASHVLLDIDAVWPDLTQEQQDAIVVALEPYLGPAPPRLFAQRALASSFSAGDIEVMIDGALAWLGGKLDSGYFDASLDPLLIFRADPAGELVARTESWGGTFVVPGWISERFEFRSPCTVWVGVHGTGGTGRLATESLLRTQIAHEMWHCLSQDAIPRGGPPPHVWFEEGIAAWITEQYAAEHGTENFYNANWWNNYLRPEYVDLPNASYQTIGLWFWLSDVAGVDLWSHIDDLHRVRADDGRLWQYITGLTGPEQLSGLGAGRLREPGWGPAWDTRGAGITDAKMTTTRTVAVDGTETVVAAIAALGARRLVLPEASAEEPLKVTVTGSGIYRWRWSDGQEVVGTGNQSVVYCLGSCECPGGSTQPYQLVAATAAPATLALAVVGQGRAQSEVTVTVEKLCNDCAELAAAQAPTDGLIYFSDLPPGQQFPVIDSRMAEDGYAEVEIAAVPPNGYSGYLFLYDCALNPPMWVGAYIAEGGWSLLFSSPTHTPPMRR